MNQIIIKIIIIICILVSILCLYNIYVPKKHIIHGTIAKTKQKIEKGLMFRKNPLHYKTGLLFKMNYGYNSMWMKNTYIPLDVIFLNEKMIVLGFVEHTKPLSLDLIHINKPSSNVLEMNAGSVNDLNIQIGDTIEFQKT
jgi:uncharacterized protein